MMRFTEGDFALEIPDEHSAGFKFDDEVSRAGLSSCMKAVDFVVKVKQKAGERLFFIEFKDLDHPLPADDRARAKATKERDKFLRKLTEGLQDEALVKKYRDSFLHLWARGNAAELQNVTKIYCVLIASNRLDQSLWPVITDNLRRKLPVGKPPKAEWKYPIVDECVVLFSLQQWNELFPAFKLERMSAR